jgi:hypothetical protein
MCLESNGSPPDALRIVDVVIAHHPSSVSVFNVTSSLTIFRETTTMAGIVSGTHRTRRMYDSGVGGVRPALSVAAPLSTIHINVYRSGALVEATNSLQWKMRSECCG